MSSRQWFAQELWRSSLDFEHTKEAVHSITRIEQINDEIMGQQPVAYDMIYLLTAIGLTPSAVVGLQYTFTHKQCIEQHNET